eukprot:TRINITY_DN11955_c0_g1_i2.p1 TRINITY_DN11955_c0_g1~~TRINITY_DN11955_c0_g1_i2.p1  ORF type:complete len:299 (+),score=63.51 TRINITY_DN11955_c0_g1_i2:44-898(+)
MSVCSIITWTLATPYLTSQPTGSTHSNKDGLEEDKGVALEEVSILQHNDSHDAPGAHHDEDGGPPPATPSHHDDDDHGAILLDDHQHDETLPPQAHQRFIQLAKTKLHFLLNTKLGQILTMPPVIALTLALFVGLVAPVRYLFFETRLSVIPETAALLGSATVPLVIITLGAVIADSIKSEGIPKAQVAGVVLVRFILLPIIGVIIIIILERFGVMPSFKSNPVLGFTLLLQCATPTAVNLVTICQVSGSGGERTLSALLLWIYIGSLFFVSVNVTLMQMILFR